nr:hypothetical protein [Lachnospiraceae bacterium]
SDEESKNSRVCGSDEESKNSRVRDDSRVCGKNGLHASMVDYENVSCEAYCHNKFLALFTVAAIALNLFIFVFTTSTMVPRYYITLFIFILPMMAKYLTESGEKFARDAYLVIFGACLLLAMTKTVYSFKTVDKNEARKEVAAYLTEKGLDFGYAFFTDANIITELTNGKTEIANLSGFSESGESGHFCYKYIYTPEMFMWSSPFCYYENGYHSGNAFILLPSDSYDYNGTLYLKEALESDSSEHESVAGYDIYIFESVDEALIEKIYVQD